MQRIEVLGSRQNINLVESLDAFNLDLAETLTHRINRRVIGGCIAVGASNGSRGQAMAKLVHPRTRFAFLTAWATTFRAIAPVRRDLPLRCHLLTSSMLATGRTCWQRWPSLLPSAVPYSATIRMRTARQSR